jgi:uncharacterized protein
MSLFFVVIIVFLVYANRFEANNVKVEHITVRSEKIKNPLSIMQLSDFHLYKGMSKKRLGNIRNSIQESLKRNTPDLILLTGDYIDKNSGIEVLNDLLSGLTSKHGIFAVLGNHDYYQYNFAHIFSPLFFIVEKKKTDLEKLKQVFRDNGVRLLMDETEILKIEENSIDMIGIDSNTVKKKRMHDLKLLDNDHFKIVLSHYPDAIRHVSNKVDMMFSGHTHGGQVTVFGMPLTAKSMIKKSEARGVSIHGGTVLLVSKGLGVSHYFPLRFFANPDICIISLERIDYEK